MRRKAVQEVDELGVAAQLGGVHGGVAALLLGVGVGARLEEQPGGLDVALVAAGRGRTVQRLHLHLVAGDRPATAVASQALFLLNSPFMLERAKALTMRLTSKPTDSNATRVQWAYRLLFARDPSPEESGLASGVVNTAFMMGGALGLAVLASVAAHRTDTLRTSGDGVSSALTGGYHLAFVVGALFALAASVAGAVLLRTPRQPAPAGEPALSEC